MYECMQIFVQSKKEGKDQESIQSSTTLEPGYQWESAISSLFPFARVLIYTQLQKKPIGYF